MPDRRGQALPIFATQSWHLMFTWGLLVGTGTGCMALVFGATIANRWFVQRRGLVMGILTAGGAAGQLVFLPIVAVVSDKVGWETASLVIAAAALAVVPLVLAFLRDHPHERGVGAYGDPTPYGDVTAVQPVVDRRGAAARAIDALRVASKEPVFWALAGGFAICGATTNGLIGTHFVPAAHDHGMHETTAAGLLAVVGIFDIIGTIASGWLTDRFDPRYLLVGYYFSAASAWRSCRCCSTTR